MAVTDYPGSGGGNDWLQSLLASYGAAQPYGPGAAGVGLGGRMPLPGLVAGYGSGPTPGAPSMGYPAMGQPSPQGPPAAPQGQGQPFFQFGGVHPGNILQSHPPGSASLGPVFNASGSPGGPGAGPGGPGSAGNDGGFNNPYAAAAAAAAPQQPGPAPAGVGGPYVGGQGPIPINRNNPLPWQGAPTGSPSQTPRPSGATPYPPSRPKNLGVTPSGNVAPPSTNKKFGLYQSQVPGGGGPLSRNPVYTTLNLFGGQA
jgi:hypothetical protein